MDQTFHQSEPEKTIKVNLDDFDLENFDIKPINKGLGFHRTSERVHPKTFSTPRPATRLSTPKEVMAPAILTQQLRLKSEPLPNVLRTEPKQENIEQAAPREENASLVSAKAWQRLIAFLVDLTIIFALQASLGFVLLMSLGLPVEFASLAKVFSLNQWLLALAISTSVVYVAYFSILDMQASFGKDLLGLGLQTSSGDKLSFSISFLRAILSLVSFIALGLPLVLDFHSRLSETRVIQCRS